MLNPFGEAKGWAGGWGQAAAIYFCCSLFFSLFSLYFPLPTCFFCPGVDLSTGCSPFRKNMLQHVLVYRLQSLQACYQLHHGAPPTAMSLLFFFLLMFNLLKYVFMVVPPASLRGLDVSCSESVGACWTGCVWHRAAPGLISQVSPCKPHLTAKTLD